MRIDLHNIICASFQIGDYYRPCEIPLRLVRQGKVDILVERPLAAQTISEDILPSATEVELIKVTFYLEHFDEKAGHAKFVCRKEKK